MQTFNGSRRVAVTRRHVVNGICFQMRVFHSLLHAESITHAPVCSVWYITSSLGGRLITLTTINHLTTIGRCPRFPSPNTSRTGWSQSTQLAEAWQCHITPQLNYEYCSVFFHTSTVVTFLQCYLQWNTIKSKLWYYRQFFKLNQGCTNFPSSRSHLKIQSPEGWDECRCSKLRTHRH